MRNFDAIFNCMFLAIIIYQVLYFLVQYAVLKRIELFYYSMYLLTIVVYYSIYVTSNVFNIHFRHVGQVIFSATQMAFFFVTYYLYTLFLLFYLNITKRDGKLYSLLVFFKNYNLCLSFLFLALGLLNIKSQGFFDLLSLLAIPLIIVCLVRIWKLKTVHSNVVIWGTTFTVIGAICSISLIVYETHSLKKIPFNVYSPNQFCGLLDVFILGYGLSLKAAESDKKLVKSLQENQKLLETERSRLAKDLHDGLGGLLSGIKLTLGSIPGNVVLSEKNAAIFTKAFSQLDSTIAEMRRVAHSMMPEALLRFGLSEAIQDYCDGINESNTLKMKFTQIGFNQPVEKPVEVILYRIIQELTNNSIKHAAAKNIFIQLNRNEQGLTLTVEDDGKGFDTSRIRKGAGLQNVQSRVDYLKGNMEIISKPGEGSAFTIEIPS